MALYTRLGVHNGSHEQLHEEGKGLVRREKQVFQEECVLVPDLCPTNCSANYFTNICIPSVIYWKPRRAS